MGDFERTFGAGADSDEILDSWGDGSQLDDKPVPYRHWFPDCDAACDWEKDHPGIGFKRFRKLGGYEIETFDIDPNAGHVQIGSAEQSPDPVSCLFPSGALMENIAAPFDFLGPQKETRLDISELLFGMAQFLPHGRSSVFPLRFTYDEFISFMNGQTKDFTYDLDLGRSAVIVTGRGHIALIGKRHSEDDIRIYPWIFGFDHYDAEDYGDQCFLCRHQDLDWELWYDARGKSFGPISDDAYIEPSQADLADIVLHWVDRLENITSQLSNLLLPPTLVVPHIRLSDEGRLQSQTFANEMACAVAVASGLESDISIELVFDETKHSPFSAPEPAIISKPFNIDANKLKRSFASNLDKRWQEKLPSVISEYTCQAPPIEMWRNSFSLKRRSLYHLPQAIKIEGHFIRGIMSSHRHLELHRFYTEFQDLDLPDSMRSLLNS